jgi:predicted nucleotidyltransferase component of viral defense system
VCEAIDGASVSGFHFSLQSTRGDGRHWSLQVTHPLLGQPDVVASVEFARRPLVLAIESLDLVGVSVHRAYEIELPALPVISVAEAISEKLARYRRVSLGRDVYDLAQLAGLPIDERIVRRLWVLKVWGDVVDDGRGSGPLDPSDVLDARVESDFAPESIGLLARPVDVAAWVQRVRSRYSFLAALDDEERRWALCDPRHRTEIDQAIQSRGFS